MATQQTEEVSHATREPSAMEKTVVPTDAPQAKHAPASSVENGGLTSSVEQHDHGGGFDGELDVSTKTQVHKEEPTQGKSKRSRLDSDGSAKTTETFDNDAEEGAKAGHAGSKADHAAATDAQTQLRQSMSTKQLQEKYHEVFGVPTKAHNKDWIINKISERVTLELPAADNSGPTPKSPSKRVAPTATAVQKTGERDAKEGKKGIGAAVDVPVGQIRCSRNDGKNWRCSEMAMPGHKHCQKHMRWSAAGRNKQQQQQSGGAKRPRWLSTDAMPSGTAGCLPFPLPSHLMPPGAASNPLLAAPLLSAAASALEELKQKETVLRGMGGGMHPASGTYAGWQSAAASMAGSLAYFQAAAGMHKPTAVKAPFCIDSLTTSAVPPVAPPEPRLAPATAAPAAGITTAMVECSIELVPVPPGTSGETTQKTLDFSAVDSFDTLHRTLAEVVGAPAPAGGRYDPSALQIAYGDAKGIPAILGAETWETFRSRVVTIHARLLVPRESLPNPPPAPAAPASFQPSVANQFAVMMGLQPHAPPSQPPSGMDQSMLAGLQWAAAAGMEPTMAMMMMMAAGAAPGPEASNALFAAAASHLHKQAAAAAAAPTPAVAPPAASSPAPKQENASPGG